MLPPKMASFGGNEVVKHVLLFCAHAGFVPGLAVFRAAAQAGDGVDAAEFHPGGDGGAVGGRHGDVEAAIGVEQRGVLAVEAEPLFVAEEEGDAGAVFAVVEDLFGFVVGGAEDVFGGANGRAFAGGEVEAVLGGRLGVGGLGCGCG